MCQQQKVASGMSHGLRSFKHIMSGPFKCATAVLQWKRGVDQREQQAKEDFKARRKAM